MLVFNYLHYRGNIIQYLLQQLQYRGDNYVGFKHLQQRGDIKISFKHLQHRGDNLLIIQTLEV